MGLGKLITRQRQGGQTHERNAGSTFEVVIDGNRILNPQDMYRGAMSIPGAWRASLLVSDLLGSVPWDAYRADVPGGPVKVIEPTPPLLEQPSPPDTRMTTISSLGLDLVWHGNAIEVIAAWEDGWPTATYPVPCDWVGVRRVDQKDYWLPVGTVEYSIGGLSFSPHEIIHTKGPCRPGGLRGVGVLEAHLDGALSLATEQARQANSLSRHGVPTGTLKSDNPDLTSDEATDLKTRWLASQRDRTIAVLNSTTSFQPLSWNPEQLQLVEARQFSLTDMELIFGLPVGWLGGMNSARQYSNIEQDAVNLIKFTMGGHLARFEQTRSLAFPIGTTVKANLDAILRADTLTRYQAHGIAIDKGFKTVNEVRAIEDDPPLPEPEKPDAPESDVPITPDDIDDEDRSTT